MKENDKTQSPADEVIALRKRVSELEASEAQLKEQLRSSETIRSQYRLLQSILESMGEGLVVADENENVLYSNSAVENLFGIRPTSSSVDVYSEQHGITFNLPDKVTPYPKNELPLVLATRGQEVHGAELYLRRPEMSKNIWIMITGMPLKDENGTLRGGMIIVTDISDQKRAAEQLEKAQEYSRNLIDSSLDMIISVDNERRIVEFNKAAQEAFGYNKEEVIGKPVDMLYATPDEGKRIDQDTLEAGRYSGEVTNVRRSGEVFASMLAASVLMDSNGQSIGVMGVSRDISEVRRAQAIQRRLSAILETTTDFVGFANGSGRVRYVNRAGRKMVGLPDDYDVTSTSISDYHPEWTNKILVNEVLPTAVRDGIWKGEVAFGARNGHQIPVSMVVMAHKGGTGEVDFFSTISRDISERKQAEQAIDRRIDELRRLNKLFQEHLAQRFEVVEAYRSLLDELEKNPREIARIIQRARSEPLPDLQDIEVDPISWTE